MTGKMRLANDFADAGCGVWGVGLYSGYSCCWRISVHFKLLPSRVVRNYSVLLGSGVNERFIVG